MHGPSNSSQPQRPWHTLQCQDAIPSRHPQDDMRYSFSKTQRITRSGDFTRIIRSGICVADGILVLFAMPTAPDDDSIRLGITIPKKTGNAVLRNRWKRLIRESLRLNQSGLPAGYEFIIRPKRGVSPDWISIKKSVPYLARKAAKRACQANKQG